MTGPDADRIAALARNVARRFGVTPEALNDPIGGAPELFSARADLIVLLREHGFNWPEITRAVYVPPACLKQAAQGVTVSMIATRLRKLARRMAHSQLRKMQADRRRAREDRLKGVRAARIERLMAANDRRKAKRAAATIANYRVTPGAWDDGARMREALAREGRDFSADAVPDDLDRGAPCYRVIAPNFVASVMREANC